MKFRLGSLFQKNAHSVPRRLYFAILRRVAAVFSKRQTVHFVSINGKRYKRVTLGDSYEAVQVEDALRLAPAEARFPALIYRHENELLLDFVEGRPFDSSNPQDRQAIAGFLGTLYTVESRSTPPDKFLNALETDLEFLKHAGLIDPALREALTQRATETKPAEIRTGMDYVDPVAKNFVMTDNQVCAIDVESLCRDVPLGIGIAKAAVHWLPAAEFSAFVEQVERTGGLTLKGQMPFVELCFRVGWTKRKLLQGKHGAIRIDLLRELVEQPLIS